MSWTLLIDTSTSTLQMALYNTQSQALVLNKLSVASNQQASQFFTVFNSLCQQANIQPKDVQNLAVNTGPGSFTGLRVGLSFAKTWQAFFMKPDSAIYALDTFSIVSALPELQGQVCHMVLNAYRGQAYQCKRLMAVEKMETLIAPSVLSNDRIEFNQNECWVVDSAIQKLLALDESHCILFETLMPNWVGAMVFLLEHHGPYFMLNSKAPLLANYLQQPPIHQPNNNQTKLPASTMAVS